jgi:hypothetical protein
MIRLKERSVSTAGNRDALDADPCLRALLAWRREDLLKASGVGTATIQRIEKSHRPITGYVSIVIRISGSIGRYQRQVRALNR